MEQWKKKPHKDMQTGDEGINSSVLVYMFLEPYWRDKCRFSQKTIPSIDDGQRALCKPLPGVKMCR